MSKSHSRMYLKLTDQNLKFAISLSLSLSLSPLSLSLSLSLPLSLSLSLSLLLSQKLLPPTLLKRMLSNRRESNSRPDRGFDPYQGHSSVVVYYEIHVFTMVVRSSHCFKIGSYKFLTKDVQWLTAYAA